MTIRKHIYYSGQVQGVGFRFTAIRVAAQYDLTGYARNLPDSRVEILIDGPAAQVQTFIEELASAMAAYIRQTQIIDEPPGDEFPNFNVRY